MDIINYSKIKKLKKELSDYKDSNNLKIAKVEKDINDYQFTMATMNPNQEVKQKVTGYGTVSLPKNTANGQVSVSVKGNTRTNLAKSSNMNTDTNADGVVDNFSKYDGGAIGNFSLNDNAQKISILNSSVNNAPVQVRQGSYGDTVTIPCVVNEIVSIRTECRFTKTAGSPLARLSLTFRDAVGTGLATYTSDITTSTSRYVELKIENKIAPANTVYVSVGCLLQTSGIASTTAETADVWFKNVMIEKASAVGSYISTGTKSTISASRIKAVNKNLIDFKISGQSVQTSTGNMFNDITQVRTDYIKIESNTNYRITGIISTDYLRIAFYDANKNYISGDSYAGSSNKSTITPINAKYFITSCKIVDKLTIQLEKGTISTSVEPYTESTSYLPNVGELRSLPNGAKDEIRVSGGKAEWIKRVSDSFTLPITGWNKEVTNDKGRDLYRHYTLKNLLSQTPFSWEATFRGIKTTSSLLGDVLQKNAWSEIPSTGFALFGNGLDLTVPAGVNLFEYLGIVTLTYQLATPIITPIEVSGNLVSYPSGTVYVEKVLPVAGIYNNGITVTHTDFPISSLDKISKVDFNTGVETQLDISKSVIASDKKSFTHPDLVNGNIVFFEYFYDIESTLGECEIEYYDSRHVLKDSVTGKFYKIVPTVANGVLTNGLAEV